VNSPLFSTAHPPRDTDDKQAEPEQNVTTTRATAQDYIALEILSPSKPTSDEAAGATLPPESDHAHSTSPGRRGKKEAKSGELKNVPLLEDQEDGGDDVLLTTSGSQMRVSPGKPGLTSPTGAGLSKMRRGTSSTPFGGENEPDMDEPAGEYIPPSSTDPTSPLISPDLSVPQEERLRGVDLYRRPSLSSTERKSLGPNVLHGTFTSSVPSSTAGPTSDSSSGQNQINDPIRVDGGSDGDDNPNKSKEIDLSKEAMTFAAEITYNPHSGSVSRMVKEMKPERLFITLGFISLAAASVCQLAIPKLMGDFIDRLSKEAEISVTKILVILVVVASINAVFNFGWMAFLWIAGDRVVTRLKKQAFDCIVHREIAFFDAHRTGELLSRLSSDVNAVNGALTTEMAELIQRTVLVTGGLGYMFYLSWDLTLISMALAPLLGLIGHRMAIYFHKLAWKANDQAAKANIVAEETISCLRTVRSFAQERFMCEQYNHHCDQAFLLAKKQKIAKASQRTFVYFAGSLAVVLVLWYGSVKVKDGVMTAGALLTFVLYGMQVGEKSGQIMDNWGMLKTAAGACQRVFQLIDEGMLRKKEIEQCKTIITPEDEERYLSKHPEYRVGLPRNPRLDVPGEFKRKLLQLPIHFENVSFAYPTRENKLVLNNLNLTLEPGKVIALVGTSGGGKSTIVALLERFYKPTSGRILWGDVDINTLDFQWYHRQVGYVGQEPVLFCTTIRENILYGVKNNRYSDRIYTERDVERVAKMANAHDFIMGWANGYHTVVGERGAQISGGQKQRIAIARAMLMDPPVLLLDEATSALDNESERVVQAALDRLMVGRTTVMIAHRLSTVRNADLVVVISGGQVVEKGSHDELMRLGGVYATLVQPQLEKQSQEQQQQQQQQLASKPSNETVTSSQLPLDENAIDDQAVSSPPELHSRNSRSFVRLHDEND